MKKLLISVIAFVLLLSAVSCNAKPSFTELPYEETFDFSAYLDELEFAVPLSQMSFVKQMEQYSYNGQKITDSLSGVYYDGPNGGGYSATSDEYGFVNDYNSGVSTYYLYTKVTLDGLKMPGGISFGDSVTEVLKKLGNGSEVSFDFTADKDCEWEMTLYSTESSSLVVTSCDKAPNASRLEEYKYVLTYTENTAVSDSCPMTRMVNMNFGKESGELEYLRLYLKNDYTKVYPTVKYNGGKRYLILPVSGEEVRFRDEFDPLFDSIDIELLTAAEENITKDAAQYSDSPSLYIEEKDGKLFLSAELIVYLDPPATSVYEGDIIIEDDHEHKFFSYPITK